jgi:hypothetical protein
VSDATRNVLDAIRERHGKLTPRLVVDEARNPKHPLHHRFLWDDKKAADKFRLIQAAQIIRSVHVTVVDEPDQPVQKVRAYLPVAGEDSDDPESSYEPVESIAHSPRALALVRAQMQREWRQLRRKYEAHEEFWAMVAAETAQAS